MIMRQAIFREIYMQLQRAILQQKSVRKMTKIVKENTRMTMKKRMKGKIQQ